MKLIKLLLAISFLVAITKTTFAQDTTNTQSKKPYKHYIGIAAGHTTGNGISYRYNQSRWGAQTTFYTMRNHNDKKLSFGMTIIYKMIDRRKTGLFMYASNRYQNYKFDPFGKNSNYSSYYNNKHSGEWNQGVGIGIEILALESISMNFMGGFATYEDFDNINMTGELGIYYTF